MSPATSIRAAKTTRPAAKKLTKTDTAPVSERRPVRKADAAPISAVRPRIDRTAALCAALQRMRSELYGHAIRLARCPVAAEDIVQDTMERAIRCQHHFQDGTNLRGWAHQILFTVFISRYRRRRRERTVLDVLGAWQMPEAAPEMIALSPPVARALSAVPIQFRAVLILVDIEEMAYRDAATLLGVPLGTVMSRLHRGRTLLADMMLGVVETPRAAA